MRASGRYVGGEAVATASDRLVCLALFFSFFVGLGDWLPASFSLSELSQGLYLIVLFLLYRVPGNTCCTETRECLH